MNSERRKGGQTRRKFLQTGVGAGTALAAIPGGVKQAGAQAAQDLEAAIDFRYAPFSGQAAYCFPDDPHKSLVGDCGELRCGYFKNDTVFGLNNFSAVVEFSLSGGEPDTVISQRLEAPKIPIVHTRLQRPRALLETVVFATNRPDEGRVDNVIFSVWPRMETQVYAAPLVTVRTKTDMKLKTVGDATLLFNGDESAPLFMAVDSGHFHRAWWNTIDIVLEADAPLRTTGDAPLRFFARLPQEGQSFERISRGLKEPDILLEEAREYWKNFALYGGGVSWNYPGRYGEFLEACTRNILQAREEKNGLKNFNVGPTIYRGLWIVDGNFILESAQYLGYDSEAKRGLEAEWNLQNAKGAIIAGAGEGHSKDTAIAMFTTVRQAELSQDWSYFKQLQPNILAGANYLKSLRDRAKKEGGSPAQYNLLCRGFGDGGIGGIRSEFTNTIWALAGLKAVAEAADHQGLSGWDEAKTFYRELRTAFDAAARLEMRDHPGGFRFLPMIMGEDEQWNAKEEWDRPRLQCGQWALSQVIYPGVLFSRNDPVVQGHIRLMQACTREDIPAETGWLPHEGVWNYNAGFAAHVYLWAGLGDWARRTFHGFLNHATPLYCWREEQPIRNALCSVYVGDMPHNWASAECVLFLRHMLALEDGRALRLLEGIGDMELGGSEPFGLRESPTRFGRVSLDLEPLAGNDGWKLAFRRGSGPVPGSVSLPEALGSRYALENVSGATFTRAGGQVAVIPEAMEWSAVWKKKN